MESPLFADALEIKLKLTVGTKDFTIPGGNVKSFKVDLQPYGFTCLTSFVVSSQEKRRDDLFPLFIKQDLVKVRLELEPRWEEQRIEPLKLQGIVTQKDILEEFIPKELRVKGEPILYRHYQIAFADPAAVLWRQHFPCDLLVDKKVKDLLEAHKGRYVSLNYDWDALNKKFAINTLPLGGEGNEASFYDFVIWLVSSHNGVWGYDSSKDRYTLSASKPDGGEPQRLDKLDVEDVRIEFPQTNRHTVKLLNAYSEKPQKEDIEQDQAVDGVRHEYLVRLPIAAHFKECSKLEKEKLKIRQHEIHVIFRRYPQLTYRPWNLIKLEGGLWSDKIFPHGRVYRVRSIFLEAAAVSADITTDHNMDHARYAMEMSSQLELKSEDWVSLPPFKSPLFPLYVEGKIVSEQGAKEAATYQIYQDKKTSLDQYKVAIPLWNNQQVVLPFEPNFFTGHFYFPDYKDARVLVALDFHAGRIERFLDWRAGARLPMDSQGNHILLGKTDKSQTSIQHIYVDDKPVLHVKRTSEKDTEMIKIVEGSLILETKEEE
jgi:hypothetical protein